MKMSRKCLGMAIGVAVLGFTASVQALSTNYSFEGSAWGSADWTLLGSSSYASDGALTPAHRLRLTANGTWENGSAWLNTQTISPVADWEVSLRGEVTFPFSTGGDGLTVLLQTAGLGALPPMTGNFDPATTNFGTYLAIDLDSWQNAGDSYTNSLKVITSSGGGGIVGPQLNITDGLERGDYFNLTVSYVSATHTLSATYDSDALAPVSGNWTVDMPAVFGSQQTTVGFIGQTGTAGENHDIMSTTLQAVPEPGTLAMFGAFGLSVYARRCIRRWRA